MTGIASNDFEGGQLFELTSRSSTRVELEELYWVTTLLLLTIAPLLKVSDFSALSTFLFHEAISNKEKICLYWELSKMTTQRTDKVLSTSGDK